MRSAAGFPGGGGTHRGGAPRRFRPGGVFEEGYRGGLTRFTVPFTLLKPLGRRWDSAGFTPLPGGHGLPWRKVNNFSGGLGRCLTLHFCYVPPVTSTIRVIQKRRRGAGSANAARLALLALTENVLAAPATSVLPRRPPQHPEAGARPTAGSGAGGSAGGAVPSARPPPPPALPPSPGNGGVGVAG